jgi:hypothetical protein
VSIKDHTFLAPMSSFELCTDRISSLMGPGKLSSHVTTLPNRTPCIKDVVGGGMRPRAKTSLWVGDRFQHSRNFANGCYT